MFFNVTTLILNSCLVTKLTFIVLYRGGNEFNTLYIKSFKSVIPLVFYSICDLMTRKHIHVRIFFLDTIGGTLKVIGPWSFLEKLINSSHILAIKRKCVYLHIT